MSKRTKAVGEQAVAEKRGRSGATKPEGVVASEGGGEGSGAEVVKFSATAAGHLVSRERAEVAVARGG
jgi:hypothetical protein